MIGDAVLMIILFATGVAAGMYIYIIQAGDFRATKKMVLLK